MRLPYVFVSLVIVSCSTKPESKISDPAFIKYAVRSSFPHDQTAFTEGFLIHQGELYESTGQENSWIGIVDINTGKANKKVVLDTKYFGEGITILNNKIYQLTWQSHIGFVYNLKTFELMREFKYPTEGWGITHNKKSLIMSDGTSTLYFLDTLNLNVNQKLDVTYEGKPVNELNELEYIEGFIFANIWRTNWIAKIDPTNGKVIGFIDLSPLARQAKLANPNVDVTNGIAWHNDTKLLLITGKYWPYIFAIKIQEGV